MTKRENSFKALVRRVPCPTCAAPIGRDCQSESGLKTNPHRKRITAALKHQREAPSPGS